MLEDVTPGGGLCIIWLSGTHFYGGRAKNFRGRWRRHLSALEQGSHTNRHMQAVFNKHRRFDPTVLRELSTISEMVEAERAWLDENHGKEGCLNLSKEPTNNTSLNPETRARLNAGRKGTKLNLSQGERTRRAERARHLLTPEAIAKMSASLTGRSLSAAHRQSLVAAHPRLPKSNAFKQALAERNRKRKGEHRTDQQKAELAALYRGTLWVYKPEHTSKRIQPEELEAFLSLGWVRGKKPSGPRPKGRLGRDRSTTESRSDSSTCVESPAFPS